MARDYDHLFKLLIIGDSGSYSACTVLLSVCFDSKKQRLIEFQISLLCGLICHECYANLDVTLGRTINYLGQKFSQLNWMRRQVKPHWILRTRFHRSWSQLTTEEIIQDDIINDRYSQATFLQISHFLYDPASIQQFQSNPRANWKHFRWLDWYFQLLTPMGYWQLKCLPTILFARINK